MTGGYTAGRMADIGSPCSRPDSVSRSGLETLPTHAAAPRRRLPTLGVDGVAELVARPSDFYTRRDAEAELVTNEPALPCQEDLSLECCLR